MNEILPGNSSSLPLKQLGYGYVMKALRSSWRGFEVNIFVTFGPSVSAISHSSTGGQQARCANFLRLLFLLCIRTLSSGRNRANDS